MFQSVRIPLLFVFLWSSSYIAFELCSASIEPATFVVVRTSITAGLFFLIVWYLKASWPRRKTEFFYSALVGILIHGVYAGGSFGSIYHGIDVALCALILSLQPLLTVLLSATFLGEKITPLKSIGVLAGLVGVSMMIIQGDIVLETGNSLLAVSLCFVALMAISIATIIQKCCCSEVGLMPGACIQFSSAAVFMLPFALMLETTEINWNLRFVVGLGWLILLISLGAMSLLMMLIRRGDAGSVANLFYLVTPLVALEAWLLFDEELTNQSVAGMVVCTIGVLIVNTVATENKSILAVGTKSKPINH